MTFSRRHVLQMAGAAAAGLAVSSRALAENYPSKPVRLIIPWGAGGPTDVFGRLAAQKLSDTLGKQFVVENIVAPAATSARSAPRARRPTATPCCSFRPTSWSIRRCCRARRMTP